MTDVAEVELILDLSGYGRRPAGADDFGVLWDGLEPALYGTALTVGQVLSWDSDLGAISVEVVRLAPGFRVFGPRTAVEVADVRERAVLIHQCRVCKTAGAPSYAPFGCRTCAQDKTVNAKLCPDHAVFLDGSVDPTCDEHRPRCRDCDRAAAFWCAGRACSSRVAWCGRHRRRHPSDPDTDYCPSCYDRAFPECGSTGCASIGTVSCDWLDSAGRPCGRRLCTGHASRWQVYGGEQLGLGLCDSHRRIRGLDPRTLLFQIIGGTTRRADGVPGPRMPTLAGFGHSLRNAGYDDLALDYPGIDALLRDLASRAARDHLRVVADAMGRARAGWDRQIEGLRDTRAEGRRLTELLRRLILRSDTKYGAELAAALEYAELKPARKLADGKQRPAMLFVRMPQHLRGRLIGPGGERINRYSDELGVQIKFEGGRQ